MVSSILSSSVKFHSALLNSSCSPSVTENRVTGIHNSKIWYQHGPNLSSKRSQETKISLDLAPYRDWVGSRIDIARASGASSKHRPIPAPGKVLLHSRPTPNFKLFLENELCPKECHLGAICVNFLIPVVLFFRLFCPLLNSSDLPTFLEDELGPNECHLGAIYFKCCIAAASFSVILPM